MIEVDAIFDALQERSLLSREQWEIIFSEAFDPFRGKLYHLADRVRRQFVGDDVYLRGLVEFSNYCGCRCAYCGISADNVTLSRYRMTPEQILATISGGYQRGYRSFVLQSGEDRWFTQERLCEILTAIKRDFPVALTLSIGEWKREALAAFRQAGADRFLLRIETSDPLLFRTLHPDSHWEDRHQCLVNLKELGYQLGSGVLIGLPGQSPGHLKRDLEYLMELRLEMVGIGPFIPHPQTPLGQCPGGTFTDCLTFLALLRVYLPDSFLPATTAMGTLDPQGRQNALKAGANVLMPNISPLENRAKYELYPEKICLADDAQVDRDGVERLLVGLGRRLNLGQGHITRGVF